MLIRFLKTMPRTLNWFTLISLALLLIKIFYLNRIPEYFAGAYQLGLVIEGVLGSVFASYVFYLVVVHVKETNDKQVVYSHITEWAQRVTARCRQQLHAFENASGIPMELETITREQVNAAFVKIHPYANAPLFIGFDRSATWMNYLEDFRLTTQRDIAKIMSQLIFLEAPLVSLLTKIDDGQHFNSVEQVSHYHLQNDDLSAFADDFYAYCEGCRALHRYVQDSVWLGPKQHDRSSATSI